MASIEVTREAIDGLSDQVWRFHVLTSYSGENVTLRLAYYAVRERPTKRHKQTVLKKWDSMDKRSYYSDVPTSCVPLPDDVRLEAVGKVNILVEGAT